MAEEIQLVWVGSLCGIITLYEPHEDGHLTDEEQYHEGDEDDCVLCDLGTVRKPCIARIRKREPGDVITEREEYDPSAEGNQVGAITDQEYVEQMGEEDG